MNNFHVFLFVIPYNTLWAGAQNLNTARQRTNE